MAKAWKRDSNVKLKIKLIWKIRFAIWAIVWVTRVQFHGWWHWYSRIITDFYFFSETKQIAGTALSLSGFYIHHEEELLTEFAYNFKKWYFFPG